jgi:hypothetical protein
MIYFENMNLIELIIFFLILGLGIISLIIWIKDD